LTEKEYHIAVDKYSDNLYRFALKLCGSDFTAHDLVQDTYEKIWLKRAEIDGNKVKSYLFRTLHNKFIDMTRKHRPDSLEDGNNGMHISKQETHDLKDVLDQAFDRLSEEQKTLVLLRDYEGYNYKEIGEIMNLSESQVKVYIFRARKVLQTYLVKLDLVI
jgi:RNA polymerase sigma factor (sigma-70 family)